MTRIARLTVLIAVLAEFLSLFIMIGIPAALALAANADFSGGLHVAFSKMGELSNRPPEVVRSVYLISAGKYFLAGTLGVILWRELSVRRLVLYASIYPVFALLAFSMHKAGLFIFDSLEVFAYGLSIATTSYVLWRGSTRRAD